MSQFYHDAKIVLKNVYDKAYGPIPILGARLGILYVTGNMLNAFRTCENLVSPWERRGEGEEEMGERGGGAESERE